MISRPVFFIHRAGKGIGVRYSCICRPQRIRDRSHIVRRANDILLESPRTERERKIIKKCLQREAVPRTTSARTQGSRVIPTNPTRTAERLRTLQARQTAPADPRDPLDADALPDADGRGGRLRPHPHDDADALVASDLVLRGRTRQGLPLHHKKKKIFSQLPPTGMENRNARTEFSMIPRSLWHTPECVLLQHQQDQPSTGQGEKVGWGLETSTNSLTNTSPAPGAGVSTVTTLVESFPGAS